MAKGIEGERLFCGHAKALTDEEVEQKDMEGAAEALKTTKEVIEELEGRGMDFIKILREDQELSDLLCDVSDVEILPGFLEPQDEGGHATYNFSGRTFAREGSGGEYILLEDGSVGYWGSEGECGRLADDLEAFFELMVNCPYWMDYLDEEEYEDREELRLFAQEVFEEHEEGAREIDFDLSGARQELAGRLGIEIKEDVTDVLLRFYECAKREPRFILTYTENDGSTHSSSGSLFDR